MKQSFLLHLHMGENKLNYYLIDYENIRCDGLRELKDIKDGDVLIIFYSDQCKNITLDALEDILSKKISYQSFKASIGTKNALDFQLASYLGYLIGNNLNPNSTCYNNYYIVSNDKGYDCLCDYWKSLGSNVIRLTTQQVTPVAAGKTKTVKAASSTKKKPSKVKASDLATLEEMKKVLSKDEQPAEVLKIFNQYKTKVAINNGLVKKFKDTKKASSIYKKLKPLLKEKNKS